MHKVNCIEKWQLNRFWNKTFEFAVRAVALTSQQSSSQSTHKYWMRVCLCVHYSSVIYLNTIFFGCMVATTIVIIIIVVVACFCIQFFIFISTSNWVCVRLNVLFPILSSLHIRFSFILFYFLYICTLCYCCWCYLKIIFEINEIMQIYTVYTNTNRISNVLEPTSETCFKSIYKYTD